MILPVGTKIVTKTPIVGAAQAFPEGSVAVLVETPVDSSHSYRVRMSDGFETNLTRGQFVLLSAVQESNRKPNGVALEDHDLAGCVIYKCIVDSRAYGLETATSDTDTRGIYLPPAVKHWSLYGVPEQLENRATDEVYWELQKFLVLALKANPNILEVLHSPDVVHATPLAEELLAMRRDFVSKLVFQTYNGYVLSQFRKMTNRIARQLEPKWKHAMHLIRLLLSGITALREGVVPVRVEPGHRDRLMTIRAGEMAFEDIESWRIDLQREFEAAYVVTKLPDRPDYEAASAFLVRARRSVVEAAGEP